MNLLDASALWWLALAPLIILFWLMKLRRREVRVSAGFLWEQAAREARVDAFSRKLQTNLLLLLQLLALALMALALARPYLRVLSASAPEVAVLVDTSASMGAQGRFEKARDRALDLVRNAPAGAEVLVAAYDRTARVLVPFSTDRSQAVKTLQALRPRDVPGDGEAGRALAASLLASRPRAEAFLVGDRPPPPPIPARLRFEDVSAGQRTDNLGLTAFRASRTRDGYVAVAGVRNYGSEPAQRDLEIRRGGALVASRRVAVPAGKRQTLRFRLPLEGDLVLEARLDEADALAADDRAWTVLPRLTVLEARAVGPPNLFAERALAAVPGVRLERSPDPAGAPLVLWQGEAPWPPPPGAHIMLKVPEALRQGAPVKGPFQLTPGDSAVADVQPLRLPADAQVLLRAGDHPAVVRLGNTLLFAFDLYRSDLPLSPALPLLFADFVESDLQSPVPAELTPGEPLVVRADVTVETPEGTVAVAAGEALTETGRAGVYRVRQGESEWPVAVSLLSESESDLAPRPAEEALIAQEAPPPTDVGMAELWPWAVAAALLILLAEWVLYHRRRA